MTAFAEALAGAPLRKTITFDENFAAGLQQENARLDPELSACGATIQVVETNTLTDREVVKTMGALRMIQRDTVHCVLGSMDDVPGQQERYDAMLNVLKEFPVNIFGNENQAGAGIALGRVNAQHLAQITAEDPDGKNPENYARFFGIAPRGVVDYPGNEDLIPREQDQKGWWALTPMDTIALNLSTKYSGSTANAHPAQPEYQNAVETEKILLDKISLGHHKIGLFGDGGNGTISKLIEFCSSPGKCVLYGGLGRFGALATGLLKRNPLLGDSGMTLGHMAQMGDGLGTGLLYPILQEIAYEMDPVFRDRALRDLGLNDEDIAAERIVQLCELDPDGKIGSREKDPVMWERLNHYLSEFFAFIKIYIQAPYRFFLCENPEELRNSMKRIRSTIPTIAEELPDHFDI